MKVRLHDAAGIQREEVSLDAVEPAKWVEYLAELLWGKGQWTAAIVTDEGIPVGFQYQDGRVSKAVDVPKRRMDVDTAAQLRFHNAENLRLLEEWEAEHSDVADYRVTEALTALRKANTALRHLQEDTLPPEWHAAMASLREQFGAESSDV